MFLDSLTSKLLESLNFLVDLTKTLTRYLIGDNISP
jgi:hypothetical protein